MQGGMKKERGLQERDAGGVHTWAVSWELNGTGTGSRVEWVGRWTWAKTWRKEHGRLGTWKGSVRQGVRRPGVLLSSGRELSLRQRAATSRDGPGRDQQVMALDCLIHVCPVLEHLFLLYPRDGILPTNTMAQTSFSASLSEGLSKTKWKD